jgi:transcriptional regulator with XRE-family HTH domain
MATKALPAEELYKRLGQRIRQLRTVQTVSQEALAEKLETTANTVSRWETATYKPSVENLYSLAKCFRISVADLFDFTDVEEAPRVNALLDAVRGLDEDDLDEVITYALFRRARQSRLKK